MTFTLLRSSARGTGRPHQARIYGALQSLLLGVLTTLTPEANAQPAPPPAPDISFAPVFTKAIVGRPVVQANFLATQTPPPNPDEAAVMPPNFFAASLFGGHIIKLNKAWIEVTPPKSWQLRVYDAMGEEIEKQDQETFWKLPVTLKDEDAVTGTWSWSGAFEVVRDTANPPPAGKPQPLTMQLKYKEGTVALLNSEKTGPSEEIWPADVWLVAGGAALAQLNPISNTTAEAGDVILWKPTADAQPPSLNASVPNSTVAKAFAWQWLRRCQGAGLDRTVAVVVVPSPGARLRDWCSGAVAPPASSDPGAASLFRQAQRLWAVPWEKNAQPPDYEAVFHYRGLVFWHGAQDADFAEGTHEEEIGQHDPYEWPPFVGEPAKNSVRSTYASALANDLLLPWWKSQVPTGSKFSAHPLQVLLVQPPPVSHLSSATQNRIDQWEKAPGNPVPATQPKFNEPVSTLAAIRFAQFDVARHFELAKTNVEHPETNTLFEFATPGFAAGQVNLLFPVQAGPSQDGKLQPMELKAAGTTLAELAFWQQNNLEKSLCPTLTGSPAAGWQILARPLAQLSDRWLSFANGPKPPNDQNPKLHWPAGSGQEPQSSGAPITATISLSRAAIRTQAADAPEGPWPRYTLEGVVEVPLPAFDLPLIKRPP